MNYTLSLGMSLLYGYFFISLEGKCFLEIVEASNIVIAQILLTMIHLAWVYLQATLLYDIMSKYESHKNPSLFYYIVTYSHVIATALLTIILTAILVIGQIIMMSIEESHYIYFLSIPMVSVILIIIVGLEMVNNFLGGE